MAARALAAHEAEEVSEVTSADEAEAVEVDAAPVEAIEEAIHEAEDDGLAPEAAERDLERESDEQTA